MWIILLRTEVLFAACCVESLQRVKINVSEHFEVQYKNLFLVGQSPNVITSSKSAIPEKASDESFLYTKSHPQIWESVNLAR
jgi:hypothetical protein